MLAESLSLATPHWKIITAHLSSCLPEEGCGLIGGRANSCEQIFPITNELHSPTRFRMNPHEQWQAFRVLERESLDLLAIFHSHPQGPSHPSVTDQAEFAYPGILSVICMFKNNQWQMQAFRIESSKIIKIPITIV